MKAFEFILQNLLPIAFLAVPLFFYIVFVYSKRITRVAQLPKNYKNFEFHGLVISVGDGDGFKAIHMPALRNGNTWTKEDALQIRLAAIDAPEVRFFGRPGQPFSKEAKACLKNLINSKKVRIRVLDIDRYNRIVAMVFVKVGFLKWKNVNLELVRLGMACVYRNSCSSFGEMKNEFERVEIVAKEKKLGIWSDASFVLPHEFKYPKRVI